MIGTFHPTRPTRHRAITAALQKAADETAERIDTALECIRQGFTPPGPRGWAHVYEDLGVDELVPRRYLDRYDEQFLAKFLTTVRKVKTALADPRRVFILNTRLEEIAMHAILALAEENGLESQTIAELKEDMFEDLDHEWLYDDRFDGIEDSEAGRYLGVHHMRFAEWDEPLLELPVTLTLAR